MHTDTASCGMQVAATDSDLGKKLWRFQLACRADVNTCGCHKVTLACAGNRGEHDAQLQAFLQAQTSHYSWHPPSCVPMHQMRPPM